MKRVIFIAALSLIFGAAKAQDEVLQDTVWRINGKAGLVFNQVALTNWAAGGQNSLAGNVNFNMTADYKKDKWMWNNAVVLGYGLSKQGEDPLNKTDDQILLNTTLGYEMGDSPWYATFNANFRTQFADGFNLPDDSTLVSTFMAPGYLVTGLGFKYEKSEDFKILLSPITNKTTFVLNDVLSAQGAYGVDSLSNVRGEFGAFLTLFYKKEVVKNVTITTLYTMFGNYETLAEWDINWDLIVDFKINDWLSANLVTNMIYDQDVAIPIDTTDDGINDSFGPRVQFRQALGIGLVAKFSRFR